MAAKAKTDSVAVPVAPLPPLLNETEIANRAVSLRAADGQRVYAYIEHGHLGIKPAGGPPAFIHKDEKAKLRALMDLPVLPPKCAHGKAPGECASCGKPAGPA